MKSNSSKKIINAEKTKVEIDKITKQIDRLKTKIQTIDYKVSGKFEAELSAPTSTAFFLFSFNSSNRL